ncbi:hypothetical protein GF327_09480 [Candidatus Woesearchaeota archaeon]|nr:hypothetical protein [Candidatus Woesearchaeota archaeon]
MIIKDLKLRDYPYKSRKGLSERLAKKHFKKKGFEVFRGSAVLGKRNSFYYYIYPNVKNKYDRLEKILEKKLDKSLVFFRKLLRVTKGIPDYFVFRDIDEKMMFVEVKLEHEQIRIHQFEAMSLIEAYGFDVIVVRYKKKIYRKKTKIDLKGDIRENKKLKNRVVLVKQEKLWKRYEK